MNASKHLIPYLILFQCFQSFSQGNYIHPTTIQIFYSISDFKRSSGDANVSKTFGGLGVAFTKGISNRFDWYAQIDFLYGDSMTQKKGNQSSKQLLVETDAGLRYRILKPASFLQPYFDAGLGFSIFGGEASGYAYPGAGIQLNISSEVFVLLNYQRRLGFTNALANHNFYSIGLAGNIGKKKARPVAKKSPASTVSTLPQLKISDRDKDGIVDSLDLCPDNPGPAIYHGCPDSDQDGIPDNTDACPTVPGVIKYMGCPIPDTDKDGINDEEDSCKDVPGIRQLHGCPPPLEQIKAKLDSAAKNIFFKTGSHELLPASFPALDTVVNILKNYPAAKIQIEGHTDNVGAAKSNQELSENRAREIVDYLMRHGVDGERLNPIGFGEERPIADNKTSQGRQMNRRVELRLLY